MEQQFKCSISAKDEYKAGEDIHMTFTLENLTDKDRFVLTSFTPLEGLESDCLELKHDDMRVNYDGIFTARIKPGKDNYVLVPARKSVSREFDLSEVYPVEGGRMYTLAFDGYISDHVPATSGDVVPRSRDMYEDVKLSSAPAEFRVASGNGPAKKTLGMIARENEKPQPKISPNGNILPPVIIGATDVEKQKISDLHYELFSILGQELNRFNNNAQQTTGQYLLTFGAFDQTRYNAVRGLLQGIYDALQTTTFSYDLNDRAKLCTDNKAGYIFNSLTTIFICRKLFFSRPLSGEFSQMGIVLNLLTTAVGRLEDSINDARSIAKKLAKSDPIAAIKSPGNYEYNFEITTFYWTGNTKIPPINNGSETKNPQSNYNPGLAVYNDRLYMTYKGEGSDDLYFAYFDGKNWYGNQYIIIPGHGTPRSNYNPGASCYDDKLYIVYKGFNRNDLYFSYLDGDTWRGDTRIPAISNGSTNTNPKSSEGPGVACYNDRLYLVYKNGDSNDLYYAYFDGKNWYGNKAIQISGGGAPKSDHNPRLAVFAGRLYMVYKGFNNKDLYYAYLDGETWHANVKISSVSDINPQSNQSPGLAQFNDILHVVYKGEGSNTLYTLILNHNGNLDKDFWLGNVTIESNLGIDPKSNYGPSLALYKDNLYMIYKGGGSDDLYVSYQ